MTNKTYNLRATEPSTKKDKLLTAVDNTATTSTRSRTKNIVEIEKYIEERLAKIVASVEKRIDDVYTILGTRNSVQTTDIISPLSLYNLLLEYYDLTFDIGTTYRDIKDMVNEQVPNADHKYFILRAYKDRKPIETYFNIIKKPIPKIEN